MQIPILNGIFTNEDSDFRTSYPQNLIPVPKSTGISQGYLRPADGIIESGTGPGIDRGGINWRDECYRVMGTKLVKIFPNGSLTELGDVGSDGQQVTLDYSFDHLCIVSNFNAFLFDGSVLQQITDPDLGNVFDMIWVDGYFMFTDGEFLILTDLDDPFSIRPLKYTSSEADPDPIVALLKIRNEPHVLNRYTTEVFNNVGGKGFPFERIEGSQIEKGTMGTHSCNVFMETIGFIGQDRNEAPAIYQGYNGRTVKISTREIDQILLNYTLEQLERSIVESRLDKGHQHLWISLPDQVLVYDGTASLVVKEPVWFTLTTSLTGLAEFKGRNLVWCYDKWLIGDPSSSRYGFLTDIVSSHYGEEVGWSFGTLIVYNEGRGVIFHELELVALTGRAELGVCPTIWTQYSLDGEVWSQEKGRTAGKHGERSTRITWFKQGHMRNFRMQRFRGTSESRLSFARLEAQLEPLNV